MNPEYLEALVMPDAAGKATEIRVAHDAGLAAGRAVQLAAWLR